MPDRYILALDQGTTSSRAIVFDRTSSIRGIAQREFRQIYPKPGWVEHDPREIWSSQVDVLRGALDEAGIRPHQLEAVGITNQRETAVLWNRRTGEPVHNAIVWQCRRTSDACEQLVRDGHEPMIYEKTGLVVDAYFSGTKVRWLLDTVPEARTLAEAGDLAFGTIDSWLLWNLTGGAVHATDVTNACRTMLCNIHTLDWDDELLAMLDIPRSIMPEVVPSSGSVGMVSHDLFPGVDVPIAGIAGDQHAALFGQTCFDPGMVKNTYGTGCFILINTGGDAIRSTNRLLTTPAWSLAHGQVTYAMEGSIFIAGAAVQWLRDAMKLIATAAESEHLATQVQDSAGVYVVPAFVGLGAPHWDSYARGAVLGLTAGASRNHIVRATLESIAFQTRDVVDAMAADRSGSPAESTLRVDGGASANDFLMQFQADILGAAVERPAVAETTALGAAYLAGLATGYWSGLDEIRRAWRLERRFEPEMSEDERETRYAGWQDAVSRVRGRAGGV